MAVRLRAALPSLHPAEQRVAHVALAHAGNHPAITVARVAELAETSTATVVRVAQRFGHHRFKSFWMALALDAERRAAMDSDGAPQSFGDIEPGDDLEAVIAKVFTNEALSVSDTRDALDRAALARAVALVAGAGRVDLFGVGAGAVVMHDLQQKLSRIGRTALHWPDNHAAWTAAAALPPGAVALAVSHSGETPATVEFLRIARQAGAPTIAVTNHAPCAMSEQADVVLLTAAREAPFRSGALGSRMAQLFVLDCLFIGVAQDRYEASMTALKNTYAAVRGR